MSNVLTALAPILFSAMQVVPRELTGFLPSISLDFDSKGVALGDTVKVPIIAQGSLSAYTPAMTTTAGADNTPSTATLTLGTSKQYTWNLTGEQERSLMNGGDNAKEFMRQNVEQGVRTIINQMESDVAGIVYQNASRAFGTPGTAPFATNIAPAASALQILLDNGITDVANLTLVMNTNASTALRGLITLNNQFPGSDAAAMLSLGILTNQYGVKFRESAAIVPVTKGTGTSYTSTAAGFAVGTTQIPLITGSGTILAGDTVTFAGDTNKYVVTAGIAAPGTITIGAPGLRQALPASAQAVTVGNTATPNVMLHKRGIVMAVRAPIIPANPLIEQMYLTDAKTGLTVLMCRIAGDGMATYRIQAVWGQQAVQSNTQALLLG